ncbi:hypothetical protein LWI29_010192 [Acer saccharum]|uniref:Jacalin-type lectin domain-containing protein n=1 Tax=Acer saccharum TaxID=4024 RepID=A0AA39T2P3_ACESA|nr:hypothetical protein LWI29_010192 [Acer saccharum]
MPNGTKGIPFNVPLEDREIVGFFGRACDFIDAIGVYRKGPFVPIVTIKEGITMNMDLPREVGPWGGNKGKSWDDGLVGGIQQIDVHVGNGVVHAIQCRYHGGDGNLVLANKHGGGGASTLYNADYLKFGALQIELENHSYEYLVGITGFYGPIDGNCCFEGSTSCSQYQSLIKVGTWGGSGGCEWSYVAKSGITDIEISSGWVIDSLSFKGIDENSVRECSLKFGGRGGGTRTITIDWPREYLTSISGTTNDHYGRHVVESLYFHTNLNKYGPFGGTMPNGAKGIPFNVPLEDREIVGFFGRACDFIDAIGVYRKGPSIPIVTIKEGITMNMDLPREVGPWGGNKGKSWDDGLVGDIQQIDVHVGNGVVHAIQCQYRRRCSSKKKKKKRYHGGDGNLVLSNRHGGGGASTVYKIELENHSYEYMVGITGFYGPIDGNCCFEVVRSVSFYTNKGKYGPFGSEIGTFFNSPVSNAKVVGFHGRSGEYLDAIGVHVEYF